MSLLKSDVLKVIIISTLFVVVIVDCSRTDDDKIEGEGIVGGKAIAVTEFPYIAQVIKYGQLDCGAAIISKHWLLTAAHCFRYSTLKEDVKIIVGSKYRNKGGNVYNVKQIIRHEKFTNSTFDNDIALIELDSDIDFNRRQQPIEFGKINPKEGRSITVAGFGRSGEGKAPTRKLRSAVIPVVDFRQCRKEYEAAYPKTWEPVTSNMFCAGKGEDETCDGDSGGPAVINGKLVGIISWGFDCGASKMPGIYTKVKNYLEWISNHTGLTL